MMNLFPEADVSAVRAHFGMIHERARLLARTGGKLIVAGYGEDPSGIHPRTGKPGAPLPPVVGQFAIGDIEGAVDLAVRLSQQRHRNVYAPLCVMRSNLERGKKGSEADIVEGGVMAIVVDFDDADAHRWRERLPLPADYVLKTSQSRWQAFYLFDRGMSFAEVKPIGLRLREYTKTDSCGLDLCHVWRIPGLLNWPTAKKIREGRSPDPTMVRVEDLG
jgi:hypothetical protein